MMNNKKNTTRSTALTGMLFALAMVLSFLEGSFAPILGLPPGVKPGLANIVVMYALFCMGRRQAAALIVLKSLFAFLTRGAVAALLSLCGGVLSLLGLIILCSLKHRPTYLILSVSGALLHNIGQLLALRFLVTSSVYTIYYLPVLLISGLVMGSVTAISLKAIMPIMERLGLGKK